MAPGGPRSLERPQLNRSGVVSWRSWPPRRPGRLFDRAAAVPWAAQLVKNWPGYTRRSTLPG